MWRRKQCSRSASTAPAASASQLPLSHSSTLSIRAHICSISRSSIGEACRDGTVATLSTDSGTSHALNRPLLPSRQHRRISSSSSSSAVVRARLRPALSVVDRTASPRRLRGTRNTTSPFLPPPRSEQWQQQRRRGEGRGAPRNRLASASMWTPHSRCAAALFRHTPYQRVKHRGNSCGVSSQNK